MINKNIKLALLGVLLFGLSIFSLNLSDTIVTNENDQDNNMTNHLTSAGFWDLTGNPIYIDDLATGVGAHNWTWAETQPWCSGSGSWADPFIIENVTIDGQGIDNCIEIKNSDKYFIIRNCSLYNSSSTLNHAGIRLNNGNNSKIINNNCSDNKTSGIQLYYSDNNTLSGNIANNNYGGIFLSFSNNNTLSGNTANNNYVGIYLDYSNSNTLSRNNINNNYFGIALGSSNNNKLSGNIISNNNTSGISLLRSDNNTLSENTVNNNIGYGIALGYSENNMLSGNTVNNNTSGISLLRSDNNTLSENTISNNSNGTKVDSYSNSNKIVLNNYINNEINAEDNANNNAWDDGFTGNYWDDYTGVDANDNGIGDTPYIVPGSAGSQDNFPIWTDGDDIAPVIIITNPLPDSVFGFDAPNYDISIDEINLDTIWYTLDGGITNHTIISLTGTLNQTAWEALSEGSVIIRFYASDALGRIGYQEVTIVKRIPQSNPPGIPGYDLLSLLGIVSVVAIVIIKKRYGSTRHDSINKSTNQSL